MSFSKAAPNTESSRPRRLHCSTWLFSTFVCTVLLFANVPGQVIQSPWLIGRTRLGVDLELTEHCEHGWPFTYLRRFIIAREIVGDKAYYQSIWSLVDRDSNEATFYRLRLVANIFCCVMIVLVSGWIFERWRRQRSGLFVIHLSDVFVLICCVAVALSIVAYHRSIHREELKTLDAIANEREWPSPLDDVVWHPGGPSWLRFLIGNQPFQIFDRVAGLPSEPGRQTCHQIPQAASHCSRLYNYQ